METKLKRKIIESGLRQNFIAGKIGVTAGALSMYCSGYRIPPAILERLAEVLDCEPGELVGYAEVEGVV